MPVRVALAFALVVALAAFTPSSAYAFKPDFGSSYSKDTPCGTYRFVMFGREKTHRDKLLREQYPASGLYRIGGPPVPLWTVSWYAYKHRVEPLCDGVHLVVQPGGGFDGMTRGVSFFANGQLLHKYPADDLVGLPVLLYVWDLSSGRPYSSLNRGTIDEKTMTYHLAPGEGTSYVFDITTGEIVSQFQPWRFAAGFLLVFLPGLLVLWLTRKPRTEPPSPQLPRRLGPLGSFKPAE
jgi:hypothetical protein